MSTSEKSYHWSPAVRVSVLTSLFAVLAATTTVLTSRSGNRAIILKNDTVYYQGLVTDDWAFFQSRRTRAEIAQLIMIVKPGAHERQELDRKITQFEQEAEEIKAKAVAHEQQRDSANEKTSSYLFLFKYFSLAQVILQIAILLLPLSLVSKQRPLEITGYLLGSIGVSLLLFTSFRYFQTIGLGSIL